jgi:two-component system, OmpR family, sensor histidine kinase KdpD
MSDTGRSATHATPDSHVTGETGPPAGSLNPDGPPRVGVGVIAIAGWIILLIVVTAGMFAVRARLNEAHVALVFLLVILGASAHVGRALGLGLAAAAFLLFDWFFLPPYGTFVVANPLDWLVLIAFFGTSAVAAQLLYRARAQADAARARSAEIDRIAVLGAETLNAGRAEEALSAVAAVIRGTVGVDWCEVYLREPAQGTIVLTARASADRASESPSVVAEGQLVHWVAEHGTEASVLMDGTSRVASSRRESQPRSVLDASDASPGGPGGGMLAEPVRVLFMPLRVRDRIVGVLAIGAAGGLDLGPSRRRVLRALSYYAALGVERVRLVRDAEHAEALRQADQLKNAVLASVSHDLRTPLTTIKALANAIAASGDARAATIEQEADRLNGFVENLLDLSRIQAGGHRRNPTPNDAEDLVGAALQRVSGRTAAREVILTVNGDDRPMVGLFDFSDTLRALVNLLENAQKYSPAATPIELTMRRDAQWLAFEVADRGRGVHVAERDRIFQPFYRPADVSPDVGGAGLGLSIARSLAVAQGGSLTYVPREGGGSVFTMRVPALDMADLEPDA